MREFFESFASIWPDLRTPWLLLGKGPSFARRDAFALEHFNTLALNHAVREMKVDLAHAIDLDVVDACAEAIENNARYLVMPWVPHIRNRPGEQTLGELVKVHPFLAKLAERNRLLWYNASTADRINGCSPVVRVRFFSAEAGLNLLAQAGVKTIRSLGIDGGNRYSQQFSDLAAQTLLANGRSSFDRQFESFAETVFRTGVDFAPLDMESPIRIFVGATAAQSIATKVLEYSIRRHSSMTVDVRPLYEVGIPIPVPRHPAKRPRTPFSFQRFVIPAAAGYRGHAIYLDSDMQVFRDIKELWSLPMAGAPLLSASEPTKAGRRPQFSVMLLNCDALRWDINDIVAALDRDELNYEELVYDMKVAPGLMASISDEWNSLERFDPDRTALLHYTDMDTQPWLTCVNPRGYLWCSELMRALRDRVVLMDDIRQGIAAAQLRPSLEPQMEEGIEDPLLLPSRLRKLDEKFVPPHASLSRRGIHSSARLSARLRARVRSTWERSPLANVRRRIRDRMR